MTYTTKSCKGALACLTMALIASAWFMPACFAADAVEADAAVRQAEHDLNSAFTAVAEAETAGADVSVLLNKLNSAADSLSRANAAYHTGDYAGANALATNCSSALEGVAVTAAGLKADAEKAHSDRLLLAIIHLSVGLALILVFGLLGWSLVKKRYLKQAPAMKPQAEGYQ